MRGRPVLGGFLLAVGLAVAPVLGLAPGAEAQDPVQLGSTHVVDQAKVLSPAEATTVESAAAKLHSDHKMDLFVVYVDRFTNPEDATDWANETAARNNLGPRDYLLAVATDDRAYYLSGDDDGPVSAEQLSQIERNDIEPRLQVGDWAGAGVAAAKGLGDAVNGGAGYGFLWLLLVGVVVVAVVVVLLVRSRHRRAAAAADAAGGGSALVKADDPVRTGDQELGFATAQHGAGSHREASAGTERAPAAESDDSETLETAEERKEEQDG